MDRLQRIEALKNRLAKVEEGRRHDLWRRWIGLASAGLVALSASVALSERPFPDFTTGPAVASQVQANFDYVAQRAAPVGAIIYYNGSECPVGWTEHTDARGHTFVGLPSGGDLDGAVGTALTNLENRTHGLVVNTVSDYSDTHAHIWARFDSDKIWYSWNSTGESESQDFAWGNGMHNDGSGEYPLAASAGTYFTNSATDGWLHTHTASLPDRSTSNVLSYVQLLACEKVAWTP